MWFLDEVVSENIDWQAWGIPGLVGLCIFKLYALVMIMLEIKKRKATKEDISKGIVEGISKIFKQETQTDKKKTKPAKKSKDK